jgi:hypothetical protein
LTYIANVYIINDPAKPENNGTVKLFKFGKKIFDKIMDKAKPTFEDEKPVMVFDLWEGADFKLRMRKVDGYSNYDQSAFSDTNSLFDGDETKLLEVVGKQHKLSEFTDRSNFKSYDELKKKLEVDQAKVLAAEQKHLVALADLAEVQKKLTSMIQK